MNRSILNAACSSVALLLFATAAIAQCERSPLALSYQPRGQKLYDQKVTECKNDNGKMHGVCDNVLACNGNDSQDVLRDKISRAQKCIDMRRDITNTWFDGNFDFGHLQQIQGRINQANNCISMRR
jgi:hypothetical protein